MDKVSASKIVALRVAKVRAKGRGKGSDGDQVDLFEAEGGRKYSRQYRRSKEKELQPKGKGGGPKVFGKARFSSRSEAGRYAANMRWRGRTGDLTNTLARDFKTWDELSSGERKKVKSFVRNLDRGMGSVTDPKYYYKRQPNSFDFRSGVNNPTNYELDERPLARDKANAKSIVKGFEDRLKRLSETPSGRVPKEKMREAVDLENRATGGKQILAATKADAKYIISQLEIMEAQTLKTARYYKFRADNNLADKPRFSELARREFASSGSYGSKLGGAVEVYEALYDTQLDR